MAVFLDSIYGNQCVIEWFVSIVCVLLYYRICATSALSNDFVLCRLSLKIVLRADI